MSFRFAAAASAILCAALLSGPCSAENASAEPLASPFAASAPAAKEYEAQWTNLRMGTIITGKVFGETQEAARHLASLVDEEIARYDDMMSVHKETALNEVNRRSGEKVPVTPEIAEMTKEALAIADLTDSAFEPTIGPVVNLWKIGFGGDAVPSDADIQKALRLVNHQSVEVTEENGQWFMKIGEGQNIDMGAIAKGFIGQKLAEFLKAHGASHALLDLGGNVVAVGGKQPGKPWRIGLQSPDQARGAYFAVVNAADESVITSGAYERNFSKNGKTYGHILSAKTGRPVATDLSSVTIVDKNGGRADALCTALFGMGWDRAQAFLKAHPEIRGAILSADLKRLMLSKALAPDVQIVDPSIQAVVIE